jgi:cell division protein FtsN
MRRSTFGGTLLGLFIGLALGLGLAAGVALYLSRAGNPYQSAAPGRESSRDGAKETARATRAEPSSEKPRFDFYKILPGAEEAKIQPKVAERPAPDKATAERSAIPDKSARSDDHAAAAVPERQVKGTDRFWLQAGSFAAEADAEDLKARLAFAGWQATIQPASVPDRGQRFRVRLGPFDYTDELTRIKAELGKRGFDAAVIKF